ncbi:protein NRT1/ PTR FAMILY 1.2 [Melia azedarach]|uniref:Protein NRT1/ PTR FAMILY 1.2 n=1 Tax=Melia azedarach TaxID=155640 RepID=A0ACC1XAQ6_MELAZ|nr:protein NRT1/ PTR FAMILY 1.2 [Melia azedarach]
MTEQLFQFLNNSLEILADLVHKCAWETDCCYLHSGNEISAVVKSIRRKTAIDQGLTDKPKTVMNMSAMWLIPQYCLFQLAEAFNAVGQIEFHYSQLSKNMASMAMAIFTLGMALASLLGGFLVKEGKESWLSGNLNKDYYCCLVNFGYFLLCCWSYGPSNNGSKLLLHNH